MASRRREPPIEDSWRMVEGEHDSFDTTILPPPSFTPSSSREHSSGFPTQLSAVSSGFPSQDSIRDFSRHQDDDHVILREPFRPSLPGSRRGSNYPSSVPEFDIPVIDADPRRGLRRSPRGGKSTGLGLDGEDDGLRARYRVDQESPSQRRGSRRVYDDDDDEPRPPRERRVDDSLPSISNNVLKWILGVVGHAFYYASKPLAFLLAIWLLFGALMIVQNMVTGTLYASVSPLCHIPGVSLLPISFCRTMPTLATGKRQAVEFDDLMGVQAKFEHVLEKSAEGASLPLEMKRSETSIRDLRTLVRVSDIQSRDELVLEFDGFIDVARQSAADLQKFNIHTGSAVDAVVAINRWTSRFMASLDPPDSPSLLSLSEQFAYWLLYPFRTGARALDEKVILDKYIEHTALVSDRISTLILEAQAVLRLLTKAEDHLSLIHDITSRSSAEATIQRGQVLWNLWTLVGKNQKLHNVDQQLYLLKQVDYQRSSAITQVNALVLELESIQAGLGDLRDRVAEPELARGSTLRIPLRVHIETINEGILRLEDARRRIGAAENDRVREALHQGGFQHAKLIEGR